MKSRPDSFLAQLTPDQQDTLYDWLLINSFADVQQKLAAPPPTGFGVQAHLTSLKRFFRRRAEELRRESQAELRQHSPEASLTGAAQESLDHTAYELAAESAKDPQSFSQAARWLLRNRMAQLREQFLQVAKGQLEVARGRLVLDRQSWEWDAARIALENAHELQEIGNDPDIDDPEKIRRARIRVFGPDIPE
jgi:hypothetical protein